MDKQEYTDLVTFLSVRNAKASVLREDLQKRFFNTNIKVMVVESAVTSKPAILVIYGTASESFAAHQAAGDVVGYDIDIRVFPKGHYAIKEYCNGDF